MLTSIELCCLVVFDLSCNVLFGATFFFVFFHFLLPLMANKVVCVSITVKHCLDRLTSPQYFVETAIPDFH